MVLKWNAHVLITIWHYKKRNMLTVTQTGLYICQQYPFIAATPDGIIHCSCPADSQCTAKGKKGCLEVKNPFTSDKIADWAEKPSSCLTVNKDGTLKLKNTHQYYAQVQCQMFVTNTDYADFVVRTKAKNGNIRIERIRLDKQFTDTMITKCVIVFKKLLLPELYDGKLKTHFTLAFVREIVENLVNDCCTKAKQARLE